METATVTEARVSCAPPINILIVGGRPILRERLRKLLGGEPGFSVAGVGSNVAQAYNAIADAIPDVVIVSQSGAPLARTMRALWRLTAGARPRTILLTTAIDKTNIVHAQALGVSGILSKTASPSLLIDSVRNVAAGYCWLGREPLDQPANRRRHEPPNRRNRFGLTKRELEVVQAVVRSYLSSGVN